MEEKPVDLQSVIEFAVGAHSGQFRKGTGLPYIVHPLAVMSQIADWEIYCPKIWKAAICHDILEDCPNVCYKDLCDVIGEDSASIVQELTFAPVNDGRPENLQKEDYMKSFGTKSLEALVVKVADRICNTLDFVSTNPSYASKYFKKADCLFETVLNRGEQLLEKFGKSSFPRMKYSRTCLHQKLY